MPKSLVFNKIQRLREQCLFKETLKSNSFVGRFCVLYYRPNGLSFSRIGIIVSKRNMRLSVNRNRFKRITRELFRHEVNVTSYDIVVIARRKACDASNKEIQACLKKRFLQLIQNSDNVLSLQ